jgi:hypothetical protein
MNETETLSDAEMQEAIGAPVPTEEQEIEQSFTDADGHFWGDKRLDPYSAQRQIAAQALGMRFGALTIEDMEELERTSSYAGLFLDAVTVIYLCYPRGRDGKQGIDESYAACDPQARKGVRLRMLTWAEAQEITEGSTNYRSAVEMMLKIIKEARINQFKPDGKKGTPVPN